MNKETKDTQESMYKYIYCNVWRRGVTVFIGACEDLVKFTHRNFTHSTVQDLVASIDTHCNTLNYDSNEVIARFYCSDAGYFIVHLPKFSFTYNEEEIAYLSHELLHATHALLDFLGVEYRYGGANEPYTCTFEYLLKEALNKKGYKKVK